MALVGDGEDSGSNITSEPEITGTISDRSQIVSVKASLSGSENLVEILPDVEADGSFTLNRDRLAEINGGLLPDGDYTLLLQTTDEAGNVAEVELEFTVDTQAPPAPTLALLDTEAVTNDSTPTFTGEAEPGATVQLFKGNERLGETTIVEGTWQITTPPLADGVQQVSAKAVDAAGNISAASASLELTVDTALPKVAIATPTAQSQIKPGARLTGMAEGTGSAIAKFSYRFDDRAETEVPISPTGEFDVELDLDGLESGQQTLSVTAIDGAGNVQTTKLEVEVVLAPAPDSPDNSSSNTGDEDTDTDNSGDGSDTDNNPSTPTDSGDGNTEVEIPTITVALANDTGSSATDGITSDISLSGTVTSQEAIASFTASFNPTEPGAEVELQPDGGFSLALAGLEAINGAPLEEGNYTLYLSATDEAGKTTTEELSFTFDISAPALDILAPLAGGNHSPTVRLVGSVIDAGGVSGLKYALNDNTSVSLTVDESGQFDAPLAPESLPVGTHSVGLSAVDLAGNAAQTSVEFQVVTDFLISPAATTGWGATTENTVVLGEQDSFLVQTALPIELGQDKGSRTLSFDLVPRFDTSDTASPIEDQVLVYLVDPDNPEQTLLDSSTPGTALFTLAGDEAFFTPGLVQWDGTTVEIDLTSLEAGTGLLRFQLISSDEDTGSLVEVRNLANTVDAEGFPNPVFPARTLLASVGEALDLSKLTLTQDVEVLLDNVRLDAGSGQYTAELQVRNRGEALDRDIAVLFPTLPDGVELLNASGNDAAGNPYVNFQPAIPNGGLETNAFSDPVEIVFDNPSLLRLALTPQVLASGPNVAPVFNPVGPLTVTLGEQLEVDLVATDANGDTVTFALQPNASLPTGRLEGNGKLVFTPTPDEISSYEFTLVASDGALDTTQQVTLDVVPDPVGTTRISGVLLDVDGTPLEGVPVELARLTTTTNAQGHFTLELPPELVPTESFDIEIPSGDHFFDPFNTGKQDIDFQRAAFDPTTGTSVDNPRRHPNLVSGFLDGNTIYGSDVDRAQALRTLDGTGKLKTSAGELLPFNTTEFFPDGLLENGNAGQGNPSSLFVGGDVNASENVILASLHTVLLREHNRLAEEIAAANPDLDGDSIYQQARRLVKAQIQHITYSEYLPVVLGEAGLAPYQGYNPDVEPMASTFFAEPLSALGTVNLTPKCCASMRTGMR